MVQAEFGNEHRLIKIKSAMFCERWSVFILKTWNLPSVNSLTSIPRLF